MIGRIYHCNYNHTMLVSIYISIMSYYSRRLLPLDGDYYSRRLSPHWMRIITVHGDLVRFDNLLADMLKLIF